MYCKFWIKGGCRISDDEIKTIFLEKAKDVETAVSDHVILDVVSVILERGYIRSNYLERAGNILTIFPKREWWDV